MEAPCVDRVSACADWAWVHGLSVAACVEIVWVHGPGVGVWMQAGSGSRVGTHADGDMPKVPQS
eukprot:364732-Chlamydomonas_euryale.AAC.3